MRGDDIRGWFNPEEGLRLASLAAAVPRHAEIVEIGCHAGRSTAYLAEGAASGHGAHITTMDDWSPAALPDGTDQEAANEVMEDFIREVDAERVTWLRCLSTDIVWYWMKPIGLLFLDATHLYEHTVRDLEQWGQHVWTGGYAAFHDYHPDHPGVIQATDEAVESGKWEHVDLTTSLRVLRKI